jgi:hypothetical protein
MSEQQNDEQVAVEQPSGESQRNAVVDGLLATGAVVDIVAGLPAAVANVAKVAGKVGDLFAKGEDGADAPPPDDDGDPVGYL